MATVYPTPFPPARLDDRARAAERKVYDALGAQLGPDHSVFYSVAWLSKATGAAARDGEVDFVVAHPERGALLLEVKGGRVGRDGVTGEWRSTDRFDCVHRIRDPFAQVRSSKHALLDKLHEHPVLGKFWIGLGHGVVLPESADPRVPIAPDARPEITLFAEDLGRIGERLERMFEFWSGELLGRMRPAPGFVPALTGMLAPSFELRRPLGPELADEDQELLRLTDQQFKVLDVLSRQRRVSVSGGAGTGKTVLALEKARRLATEGMDVLLTCFNKPLADHLRRISGPVERLTIANFHRLCWQMAEQAGIPLPDPLADASPDFFDRTLPDALLGALDRLSHRFDAIIVDEGQDFRESWWAPLLLCAKDPDGGVLYVFHDENQQVYKRVPSFPGGLAPVGLGENLRNTRRIHEATLRFYHGEPLRAVGPEGQEVECHAVHGPSEIDTTVSRVLHRLVREEGVPTEDIAILVGSSQAAPLKHADHVGAFQTTGEQPPGPGKVLVESVRRFKGLERKVIILTGIDQLRPEDERALLYVGLSRARVYLVVVATRETLARVGVGP